MTVVILLLIGVVLIPLVRTQRAKARRAVQRQQREAALAYTVDLVAVVLGSGGTVRQAVEVVATVGPEAVSPCFAAVLTRADDGSLLADALAPLSAELGPPFHPLVGALTSTMRDGAPVSLLLQRLSDDASQARRAQVELAGKRLPVLMLVPLVCCLLPAVIIGAVVPLAVVALQQLDL